MIANKKAKAEILKGFIKKLQKQEQSFSTDLPDNTNVVYFLAVVLITIGVTLININIYKKKK